MQRATVLLRVTATLGVLVEPQQVHIPNRLLPLCLWVFHLSVTVEGSSVADLRAVTIRVLLLEERLLQHLHCPLQ